MGRECTAETRGQSSQTNGAGRCAHTVLWKNTQAHRIAHRAAHATQLAGLRHERELTTHTAAARQTLHTACQYNIFKEFKFLGLAPSKARSRQLLLQHPRPRGGVQEAISSVPLLPGQVQGQAKGPPPSSEWQVLHSPSFGKKSIFVACVKRAGPATTRGFLRSFEKGKAGANALTMQAGSVPKASKASTHYQPGAAGQGGKCSHSWGSLPGAVARAPPH